MLDIRLEKITEEWEKTKNNSSFEEVNLQEEEVLIQTCL